MLKSYPKDAVAQAGDGFSELKARTRIVVGKVGAMGVAGTKEGGKAIAATN